MAIEARNCSAEVLVILGSYFVTSTISVEKMHVEVQRCQLVHKELDNAFMSSLIGRKKAAGILSSNHESDFSDTSSRGNMIGNRTGAS